MIITINDDNNNGNRNSIGDGSNTNDDNNNGHTNSNDNIE